jgi:hypothetical protein
MEAPLSSSYIRAVAPRRPLHPPRGLYASPSHVHDKNDRATADLGVSAAMAARVFQAVGPGAESCWAVTSFRPSYSRLCRGLVRGWTRQAQHCLFWPASFTCELGREADFRSMMRLENVNPLFFSEISLKLIQTSKIHIKSFLVPKL